MTPTSGVTEAMLKAGRGAWQNAIKDRNLDEWLAHMYLAMEAARPAAGVAELLDMVDGLYRKYGVELDEEDTRTAQAARTAALSTRTRPAVDEVEAAFREGFECGDFVGGGNARPDAVEQLWVNSQARAALSTIGDSHDQP